LPFGDGESTDGVAAVAAPLGADVGEAQKVETFGFALASLGAVFPRKAAKFDQAGFLWMELEVEVFQSLRQGPVKGLSVSAILKAGYQVVRVADEVDLAPGVPVSPLMRPLVQRMVQVEVGE